MPAPGAIIRTTRLDLNPLTAALLEASLTTDRTLMSRLLGATVPDDWPGDAPIRLWLHRVRDESALPWLARAIVLRETGEMVRHAGFHLPPGDPVVSRWAPGGVEIGYTVFEAHRRRGFASEAVRGLLQFAIERDVRNVLATTAESNVASVGVLRTCGFRHAGRIHDDEGSEDAWVWRAPAKSPGA